MTRSRASTLLQIPSPEQFRQEHQISLLDRCHSSSELQASVTNETERETSDSPANVPERIPIRRRITNNSQSLGESVKREITRQKYAKYAQKRYGSGEQQPSEDTTAPIDQSTAVSRRKGYLRDAQARAKAILKKKSLLGQCKDEADTAVDVLIENQRGIFFFGVPKYSANSLLPTDPRPWQNAQFRTSASDIRNAQVPDPSWEWAWNSWYVDMSRDVDEEGWEYSFAFVGKGGQAFAWHGNHPWFHSFVRRRRWLRMRRRRDYSLRKPAEPAHALTAEYFTIHPLDQRPASLHPSQGMTSALTPMSGQSNELDFDIETMEISTIGDLFLALRAAGVDRMKLLAVRKFVDDGGPELHNLGERMPKIMSMLVFQSSQRQLLRDLTDRHTQALEEKRKLDQHDHGEDEVQTNNHKRNITRTEDLLKAVHAADELVRKLEYWSDVKAASISHPDAKAQHDPHECKPASQSKSGIPPQIDDLPKDAFSPPSRSSTTWFDTQSLVPKSGESGDDTGFVTPAESQAELKRKFKGKRSSGRVARQDLDGLVEEEKEPEAPVHTDAEADGDGRRPSGYFGVGVEEPDVEDDRAQRE